MAALGSRARAAIVAEGGLAPLVREVPGGVTLAKLAPDGTSYAC